MTRDEILAMEAGPELDALIADRVWDTEPKYKGPFSTDIAAAWKIVECMGPVPFLLAFHPADAWRTAGGEIYCYSHWSCWFEGGGKIDALTAPEAICRAALLAVMDAG